MKAIFMGSPEEVIAPLKYIINEIRGLDIVGVVSQPARKVGRGKKLQDPPVASFAKEHGILTLQPEKASDQDFLNQLRALAPDLIITAAYGQILTQAFLDIPSRGTINIHPSLLPIYRGATPVQASLLNGDEETGVSILFTVKKMDAGNIIVQEKYEIKKDDTTGSLLTRMFQVSGQLVGQAIAKLADKNFTGEIQDENLVVHCKKIQKQDGFLNFQEASENIVNKYRGLTPWPGIYGFIGENRVAFNDISETKSESLKPGEFRFDKPTKAIIVGTKSKDIQIKKLKPAGKKEIDAPSFWNGLKDKENLVFDESEPKQ